MADPGFLRRRRLPIIWTILKMKKALKGERGLQLFGNLRFKKRANVTENIFLALTLSKFLYIICFHTRYILGNLIWQILPDLIILVFIFMLNLSHCRI